MPLEHHPLTREFPEFRAELQRLYGRDAHFARLAADYEALDKRVYQVEAGQEAMDDLTLQGLKLQRVVLKDEIAQLLKRAAA